MTKTVTKIILKKIKVGKSKRIQKIRQIRRILAGPLTRRKIMRTLRKISKKKMVKMTRQIMAMKKIPRAKMTKPVKVHKMIERLIKVKMMAK